LERPPSARAREDETLLQRIRQIHLHSLGTEGAPRINAESHDEGIRVGRKRVARLMATASLTGREPPASVLYTVRDNAATPAPDLEHRDFTAGGPDRLWVADIMYTPTHVGLLYPAVVMDAWSRRIVGWAMETHLRTELVLAALEMAIAQRQPTSVIHHSDQGCQYTSLAFGKRCRLAGARPSMDSVGDYYDNAMCESFFATVECEVLDFRTFRSHAEARMALFDFIEGWYNPQRRHSALGYHSPLSFERRTP
jgi:putative transposase